MCRGKPLERDFVKVVSGISLASPSEPVSFSRGRGSGRTSASTRRQQVDTEWDSVQLPAVHIDRSRWYFHSTESQESKNTFNATLGSHNSEYSCLFLGSI